MSGQWNSQTPDNQSLTSNRSRGAPRGRGGPSRGSWQQNNSQQNNQSNSSYDNSSSSNWSSSSASYGGGGGQGQGQNNWNQEKYSGYDDGSNYQGDYGEYNEQDYSEGNQNWQGQSQGTEKYGQEGNNQNWNQSQQSQYDYGQPSGPYGASGETYAPGYALEPIDSAPPPPPVPEFVEWELKNMPDELRNKMKEYAEQVWFRSMTEENQRQSWYNELADHKRKEDEKRKVEEEKKRQEEQKRKLQELKENTKKVQGTRHLLTIYIYIVTYQINSTRTPFLGPRVLYKIWSSERLKGDLVDGEIGEHSIFPKRV